MITKLRCCNRTNPVTEQSGTQHILNRQVTPVADPTATSSVTGIWATTTGSALFIFSSNIDISVFSSSLYTGYLPSTGSFVGGTSTPAMLSVLLHEMAHSTGLTDQQIGKALDATGLTGGLTAETLAGNSFGITVALQALCFP